MSDHQSKFKITLSCPGITSLAVALILREVIRTRMHVVLHGAGGEHEVIAFGILIVAIMILMPGGLTVGGVNLIRKLKRRLMAGDH